MVTKKQAQQISYSQLTSLQIKEDWRILFINCCKGGWKFTWCGKKLPEHQFTNFVIDGKLYYKYERSFLGYQIPVNLCLFDMLLYVWTKGDVGMDETLAEMQRVLWKQIPLNRQQNRLNKKLREAMYSLGLTVFEELYTAQRVHPVSNVIKFPAFTSTSKYPYCWNTFSRREGAVYTLHKAVGYDLFEFNDGEAEVLLPPGTKWRVISESKITITKGEDMEYQVPHYVVEPYFIEEGFEEGIKLPYKLEGNELTVTSEVPEGGWKIPWDLDWKDS